MRAYYDLHLHSCLSPCGDDDMTPNNIVNMASLLELDIIALTDHNSCKNCCAAADVGKNAGIAVVPGMELCTSEEIHTVCLFPDIDSCEAFGKYVSDNSLKIKNREDIYGRQIIMDSRDEIIGYEDNLLITAANISIAGLHSIIEEYNGVCYPAHIDRDSYSIIASLGEIPPEYNFSAVEITADGNVDMLKTTNPVINDMILIKSSDAHYLENMQEKGAYIELDEINAPCLIKTLKDKNCSWSR